MADNNTTSTTSSLTIYLSLTSSPSTPRSAISISRKSTTSCQLREQASAATNVPMSTIKLIFRGRMIVDKKEDNVIDEYKLEEGSVVHVMGKPIVVANNVGGSSATSSSTETGASVSLPTANLNSLNIASGSSTTSPLATALTKLLTSNDGPTYRTAVVTADKLLGNIVSHPMDAKYRTVKKSNPAFSKRLGLVTGGHDLLLASGFTIESKEGIEYYTLTPNADAWPTLVAARKEVGRVLAENNRNSSSGSVALGAGATPPSNLFPGGMSGGTGGSPDMSMLSDPNMMQNVMGMINNPMVQNMMQNDPRFANNPMLQQSLRALQTNPEMMQQMTQMMADPNVRNRLVNAMQQQQQGMGGGIGSTGGETDPFANGPEAVRRQMEQFQQMSNQFGGSSGGFNAGGGTATGGSGGGGLASSNANASSPSNGSTSSGNDNEMTEEEMIAEAIARSLRES